MARPPYDPYAPPPPPPPPGDPYFGQPHGDTAPPQHPRDPTTGSGNCRARGPPGYPRRAAQQPPPSVARGAAQPSAAIVGIFPVLLGLWFLFGRDGLDFERLASGRRGPRRVMGSRSSRAAAPDRAPPRLIAFWHAGGPHPTPPRMTAAASAAIHRRPRPAARASHAAPGEGVDDERSRDEEARGPRSGWRCWRGPCSDRWPRGMRLGRAPSHGQVGARPCPWGQPDHGQRRVSAARREAGPATRQAAG
jgi:hypothetical protein